MICVGMGDVCKLMTESLHRIIESRGVMGFASYSKLPQKIAEFKEIFMEETRLTVQGCLLRSQFCGLCGIYQFRMIDQFRTRNGTLWSCDSVLYGES